MTNKSGDIGTKTETAIVKHARGNGFGGADEMTKAQRLRLNGAQDQGDIGLCPGVMIGAKGGHMAEGASDALIASWLDATEAQRLHRGADIAFLVTKRKGKGYANAGQWWAHMPGWTFVALAVRAELSHLPCVRMAGGNVPAARVTLDDALILLRRAGFGDPLGPSRKDTTT